MTERLVKEFVDAFVDAVSKAEVAGVVTGDPGYQLLALSMITLLQAHAKGDLEDFIDAMTGVIEQKLGVKKDPANIAIEDLLKNIGLN